MLHSVAPSLTDVLENAQGAGVLPPNSPAHTAPVTASVGTEGHCTYEARLIL